MDDPRDWGALGVIPEAAATRNPLAELLRELLEYGRRSGRNLSMALPQRYPGASAQAPPAYSAPVDTQEPALPTPLAADAAQPAAEPSLAEVLAIPVPGRKPRLSPKAPTATATPAVTAAEALNRAVRAGTPITPGMTSAEMHALAKQYGYTGRWR